MNTSIASPVSTPALPLPQEAYSEMIEAIATSVFMNFIEQGRSSLSSSANAMLAAGYEFLQRSHPAPWPKQAETLAVLKRDIQISFLNGLIREGMPGLRKAVMQSYESITRAANQGNTANAPSPIDIPALAPTASVSPAEVTVILVQEDAYVSTTPAKEDATSDMDKKPPPSRHEVFEMICSGLAKRLNKKVETITLDTTFVADLGADSLEVVELVMLLEEGLGIDVEDNAVDKLITVGDAHEMACALLNLTLNDIAQKNPSVVPVLSEVQ